MLRSCSRRCSPVSTPWRKVRCCAPLPGPECRRESPPRGFDTAFSQDHNHSRTAAGQGGFPCPGAGRCTPLFRITNVKGWTYAMLRNLQRSAHCGSHPGPFLSSGRHQVSQFHGPITRTMSSGYRSLVLRAAFHTVTRGCIQQRPGLDKSMARSIEDLWT